MISILRSVRSSPHRLKLILAFAAALFLLGSNVAWACLCDRFSPTAAARNAATVFTGVVRGRVAPPDVVSSGVRIITRSEERVEFNVETVYKGDAPSRWSVSVNASDCGYVFSDGERYTVFVTADGKTNLCMGNVKGTIDPTTYGVEPITVYPSSQLIDLGRPADRLALTVLLLVGLGTLIALRIRRSRNA
jgi:hypothetical protein